MKTQTEHLDNILGFPAVFSPQRISTAWTRLLLALGDLCSMILSIWLAHSLFQWLSPTWEPSKRLILELSLILFGSTYVLSGNNRSRDVNPVEALRHLTVTTTIIFLTLFTFNAVLAESRYPPAILAFGWLFSVVTVPLARWGFRWLGVKLGIWGEPVVVIGNGSLSQKVVQYLLKNPHCGMRPVLVLDGLPREAEEYIRGVSEAAAPIPVTSLPWPALNGSRPRFGASTAIIVAPDLPSPVCEAIASGEHLGFSRIITVTNPFITRSFGLTPLDFGGVLGFEEPHYELNRFEDRQIRVMDLLLIVAALPMLVPLFLFIMTAIKLDSRGSIFYRQVRIGKNGQTFKVLKFRTMVVDADEVLTQYLEANPEMMAEWKRDQKLKEDPRITRVGKFLRKASLDELPQLWNVLKGEMSLVGPRPIVHDEIERYGDRFKYYAQVPPGISGLWQVSGRNDINYEQRVGLDEYYVRNRSIWMNLHILIRTFLVVLRRDGAY